MYSWFCQLYYQHSNFIFPAPILNNTPCNLCPSRVEQLSDGCGTAIRRGSNNCPTLVEQRLQGTKDTI